MKRKYFDIEMFDKPCTLVRGKLLASKHQESSKFWFLMLFKVHRTLMSLNKPRLLSRGKIERLLDYNSPEADEARKYILASIFACFEEGEVLHSLEEKLSRILINSNNLLMSRCLSRKPRLSSRGWMHLEHPKVYANHAF